MTVSKTLPKIHEKINDEYQQNIQKYSLYEINLAFKVICGLKKRVKRRKKKNLKS